MSAHSQCPVSGKRVPELLRGVGSIRRPQAKAAHYPLDQVIDVLLPQKVGGLR